MALRMDLLLFPGGKKKAVTFSYDDAVTQDIKFVGMLNQYGLKGTFNLNSGLLGVDNLHNQNGKIVAHNKLPLLNIADVYEGHELAIHGLTHMDMTLVGYSTATYEIITDRANIEEITKKPVRGMAYPFGKYNQEIVNIVNNCGIEYSRTVENTGNFEIPKDFFAWNPTCHHADEMLFELAKKFLEPIESYYGPRLFYVWGHTYEFDMRDDWRRMEEFLKCVSGKEDVWYATNIEICDYIKAASQLKYSASGKYVFNPTVHDIWIGLNPRLTEIVVIHAGEHRELNLRMDGYLI